MVVGDQIKKQEQISVLTCLLGFDPVCTRGGLSELRRRLSKPNLTLYGLAFKLMEIRAANIERNTIYSGNRAERYVYLPCHYADR